MKPPAAGQTGVGLDRPNESQKQEPEKCCKLSFYVPTKSERDLL